MTVTCDDDPVAVLQRWLTDAAHELGEEGRAFVLATASAAGAPSARVVLCRSIEHDGGVTFYTNYGSRKARELAENPRASAVFHWWSLDRQARVEGEVEKASPAASDAYWAARARGSQIGAWASPQSDAVSGREELQRRVAEVEARFHGQPIPRPAHWGGYVLRPRAIEFWERGPDRLHDRVRFERVDEGWSARVLGP